MPCARSWPRSSRRKRCRPHELVRDLGAGGRYGAAMPDSLTSLGVGGILAILILDRVFAFLRIRGAEGQGLTAGDQSPDYWQQANKRIMLEIIEGSVLPLLKAQTDILSRLETRYGSSYEQHLKNSFSIEEINKGVEKLRMTLHTHGDLLQRIAVHESGRREHT